MGSDSPGDPLRKPQKRKKQRGTTISLQDLPNWLKNDSTLTEPEMFIHVKPADNIPVAKRNRFLLAKYLKTVTNNITKASFNGKGDLILKVKGEKEAEKVLKIQKIGDWPVTVERHQTLNSSKGVIFNPDICWLTEREIIEGLVDYKVKEVFIFKRTPRNTETIIEKVPKPFGLAVLTFDTQQPPQRIKYGFEYIEVRKYIPNPMRCRKCQKLGHTAGKCQLKKHVCEQCGKGFEGDNVPTHECTIKMCVNCVQTGHASNDRDCPKYLMAKQVETIMVMDNKTRYEARQLFFSKYQSIEGYLRTIGKNLAQIVADAVDNDTQKTQQTAKNTNNINNNNKKDQTLEEAKNKKPKSTTKRSNELEGANSQPKNYSQTKEVDQTNVNTPNKPTTSNVSSIKNKFNSQDSDSSVDMEEIVNENSHVKLTGWKVGTTGVTYIFSNGIKDGVIPELDLSKYEGKKKNKNNGNHIKYVNNTFNNEKFLGKIATEVSSKSNCNQVMIRIVRGVATIEAIEKEDETTSDDQMSVNEDL